MTTFISQTAWAAQLGVSVRTFRRWRALGLIPLPCDLPGRPRWTSRDVERTTATLTAKVRVQSRHQREARA